jgi:hypothetical protein
MLQATLRALSSPREADLKNPSSWKLLNWLEGAARAKVRTAPRPFVAVGKEYAKVTQSPTRNHP